jgi:hypothetical protein
MTASEKIEKILNQQVASAHQWPENAILNQKGPVNIKCINVVHI